MSQKLPPDHLRCKALNSKCYKCYHKFDEVRLTECPKCGADRRCRKARVKGINVCWVHGAAGGGIPKHGRFMAPASILAQYNRVLKDPDILNLASEMALLAGRTQMLMDEQDDLDIPTAVNEILGALEKMRSAVSMDNRRGIRNALNEIEKALTPLYRQKIIWHEARENIDLSGSMTMRQNVLMKDAGELIPKTHVLEVIVWVNRIAVKYIRASEDKKAYSREILAMLPRAEAAVKK